MSLRNIRPVYKKPGAVLIINCITFDAKFNLCNRPASSIDVDRLKTTFNLMDFAVEVVNDPFLEDIQKKIHEVSEEDFTDLDSLVIVFMSHGNKDGVLFCRDGKFQFQDMLIGLFQNENKSLRKISKYIVIEACKGDFDPNAIYDSKSSQIKSIPNLIGVVMSSFEGYVSFMDPNGSPFIKGLCNVLSEHCKTGEDLPFWDVLCNIIDEFEHNDQQCPMVVRYKGSDSFTLHTYLEH